MLYGYEKETMEQWIAGVDEAGEKAWEAFARPCQIVLEALAEQNYRQGVLFL